MNNLKLSQEDSSEMKRFYLHELEGSLRRVKHLQNILGKLDGVEIPTTETSSPYVEKETGKKTSLISTDQVTQTIPKKKGTRGRKSLWGNFILNLLQQENRPLSYTEIINTAVDKFNLPENKIKNVKQAITNSAFRLRVTNKRIDTFGLPGKKERFLCLKTWYENGKLRNEYQGRLA